MLTNVSNIDRPEYFVAYKMVVNGQVRFFSNVMCDLVEFCGFQTHIVLPIGDYNFKDRNFNKVTVLNN